MPYVKETTHLAGPLTITVQHECPPCPISGYDDPWAFSRSGEPSIWGNGLRHRTINDGVYVDPKMLGEVTGGTVKAAVIFGGLFLAGLWAFGRKKRR